MRKKPAVQRTAVSPQRSSYSRKGSRHPQSSALRLPSPGRGRRRQKENRAHTTKLIKKSTPLPPTKSHTHHPSHPPAEGSKPTDPSGGQRRSGASGRKPTGPITRTDRPQDPRLVGKDSPTLQTTNTNHKKRAAHLTASGSFYKPRQKRSHADAYTNLITCIPLKIREVTLFFLRKEVIQPQVPLRLPCYDLVPITEFIFGA